MKKTNVKPLGKNVLVLPIKPESKTETGIYFPESASPERPQEGQVVAVGTSDKITVKPGQTVIYARYGGTEIKIDNVEYLVVKNEDILAVVG